MDEELKSILEELRSDPDTAIGKIKSYSKSTAKIESYIREYRKDDRSQRDTQVDRIQQDTGKNGENKAVRIHINHAQNIVETLAAFVCGKPVNLVPSVENKLHELVKQVWRVNRLDSKVLKALMTRMSETQVAMHFYIVDIKPTSVLNKVLTSLGLQAQRREIKAKVLHNGVGTMTPYFNDYGDMLLFMWQYQVKRGTKTVNYTQIWDEKNYYEFSDENGEVESLPPKPHGFDRIPIVYDSQDEPEWYPVRSAADRHEVALSKIGDSTDYSGHPILVTEGVVNNLPTKNQSGKHFNIPKKYDEDGKEITGAVRFLEAQNAPELNRLEIEKLEDSISYGSGVPNLSLDRLKSLGNVAEKTVKLMFLGTELKAQLKRAEVRTFIERSINILVGGIVTTTNTNLRGEGEKLYYDIHFNSILPNDVAERVNTATKAVNSGLMSKKTGVSIIDLVDDVSEEIQMIDEERAEREKNKISGEGELDRGKPNPREPENKLET
jgi:SPP1 family phage portal protein